MPQLSLRQAEPADAAALLAIYEPYVRHSAITFEYEPPSVEAFSARIADTLTRYPWLVAESDGMPVGFSYAHGLRERPAYAWDAELSIYLSPQTHHCGIGTRLYRALCALLREQHLVTVYACITTPNPASLGFHEAFGFNRLGVFPHTGFKQGSWYDIVWMEYALRERVSPPEPFIPFPDLPAAQIEEILSSH